MKAIETIVRKTNQTQPSCIPVSLNAFGLTSVDSFLDQLGDLRSIPRLVVLQVAVGEDIKVLTKEQSTESHTPVRPVRLPVSRSSNS